MRIDRGEAAIELRQADREVRSLEAARERLEALLRENRGILWAAEAKRHKALATYLLPRIKTVKSL